jgi:hypothetical protein
LNAEALISFVTSLKFQGFQCSEFSRYSDYFNITIIDYADIKGQGLDKYFFKPGKEKVSAK